MFYFCKDCPRQCGVMRPETGSESTVLSGVCGSPRQPVVARAGLHFWEEPVVSGEKGSGTVFFSGCNLHCVFCQNYNISTMRQGKQISVSRLKEIYQELISQGAHNINLVTPGHYSSAILESLADPLPVPVVYNTNGYDSVETLRKFEGKVQIYLPDLKYMDNALAARYSGAKDYVERATAAIREMFRQTGPFEFDDDGMLRKGVIIRHLILPGCVENSLKVIRFVEENFAPDEVIFSLMRQYIPCGRVSETEYPELNRKVTQEEYDVVEEALFNSTIEAGFVQDDESASKEFIPDFDGSGVL
ncbi:MAG: radical SAM protein [Lentisphaeria bacterium]|nr:radical SAM protein [Lentisphaeria bacterium]MBQ8756302.1 radical SAM protein [Lentisphaeria bacterium]